MVVLKEPRSWRRSDAKASRCAELTADEQAHVKRALAVLRVRLGGWEKLATAMGVKIDRLKASAAKSGRPGAALALYVARVAKVQVEDVLSGAFPAPGACPLCGRVDGAP